MARDSGLRWLCLFGIVSFALVALINDSANTAEKSGDAKSTYSAEVQPLLAKYCLECHAQKVKKGELDLERFNSIEQVRKDLQPWPAVVEMLENGEMPPKGKPQPSADERKRLIAWTKSFIDAEARARAGDPGRVVLRRLNNAEYNYTIRDLTGIDLQPAREFPVDGAAGEGFTNTGESLTMSPTLLSKFLKASKDIAAHAVLLPSGFRFSASTTRRDWTDEVLAELRKTYRQAYPGPDDGRLDFTPYLRATIVHREGLLAGATTLEAVAVKEKLNRKYLTTLWSTLTDQQPSLPLVHIRDRWRQASPKDVEAIAAEIRSWQTRLWKFNKIGSYVKEVWQEASNPIIAETHAVKMKPQRSPGQKEIVLYLVAREAAGDKPGNQVVWQRPRFEGAKQETILLRDIDAFSAQSEIAANAVLADTAKYLDAIVKTAVDPKLTLDEIARKDGLNATVLKNWSEYLALATAPRLTPDAQVPLQLLATKVDDKPAIKGWGSDASDHLPVLVSNSTDRIEMIPGTVGPHKVVVHPAPTQFAAVVWQSPVSNPVRVEARIAHAHPACGNGVAWWLEHRQGRLTARLDGGTIDLGKQAVFAPREIKLAKGDTIVLAVGARDGNHTCDLTSIDLTITEMGEKPRKWDLAGDVADTIVEGNPHADKFGNKEVWQFARGPDPTLKPKATDNLPRLRVPPGSTLARWRDAAIDPAKRAELGELAKQVQSVLIGGRPGAESAAERIVFDKLTSLDGPLFQEIDLNASTQKEISKQPANKKRFGLERERFGRHPGSKNSEEASLFTPATSIIEVRLPAAIFKDREFVVDCKTDPAATNSLVQFEVMTAPPDMARPAVDGTPWVGSADLRTANSKQPQEGFNAFRSCFPIYLYHSQIVPVDEAVCLRMYFREDEPLIRLFLDGQQKSRLDHLWTELRFITQFPIVENKYLPQFIGFVTQDQPKELLAFFEAKREPFRQRALEFEKEMAAAAPKQLDELFKFAARAFRRPLTDKETAALREIYESARSKKMTHPEAFRTVLTRIFVSPSFLYRFEQPGPGKEAKGVTDWELATRLSYFLWSSLPDAELTQLAREGRLHDPKILVEQTERMLGDGRIRALAIEFGAQWIHVRGFDELQEKNEKLFPTFDAALRKAIYEESIQFLQDLFQNARPLRDILDADRTYLNELLAKHYGIPDVTGPQWRKVEGVKKFGRGGILGLASVQTKESGASRTSPVLRGNWVVETLLGEKIPRPPPNVPRLPEEESGNDGLTMRQLTEKHTRVAECAVCHVRIDPYGFALEKYDPIGRFRAKDLGGLPVDARAKLRDGTEFDGIDGLRNYLLTQKKDVFVRNFCKKLLGYSLGRAVILSDQPLIDEMISQMDKHDGRLSAAVIAIVSSPQFRMIRGMDAKEE